MEEKYKNILFQGWMLDCLEFMEKEEQDKYLLSLFRSAIAGKVLTDNKKWEYSIEKALKSIEKTREAYYQKATKIGMKGKEYGIQGKEFGKLGGRPRKGETKEEYDKRKRLENESLVSEEKGEDSKWTKMLNEIKQDKELIRQIKDSTLPKEVMNDFAERYGAETASDVLDWVLNKYIIN